MVHAKDKYLALKRIADYYPDIYGIVFCRTRMETQDIADKLIQDGYNADSLHGELSQAQRDLVMSKFRQRRLQILVATDVAARGLDVDDLTHVINYGLPDDIESYTHRSGRTGRAGKTGTSISIINLREKGKMKAIEKVIGKKFVPGVIPSGKEICEKQLLKVMDEIERVQVNEEEIAMFLPDIYRKLDWLDKEDLIKRVVSLEFNHFLEYYSNAREIETPKQNGDEKKQRQSNGRKAEPGYARLFINLGKQDNLGPAQIIEMINHNTHRRITIGRIDLMSSFSFFEVKEKEADIVIKALSHLTVNRRRVVVELAGDDRGSSQGKRAGNAGRKDGKPKERSGKKEQQPKPVKNGRDNFRQFINDDDFWSDDSQWAKKKRNRK